MGVNLGRETPMAKQIVTDELWEIVEPLIPKVERRYRYPGRKRIDDRKVLTGILFVLRTGISWPDLPQEMGCGAGMTCWRRLQEWNEAGVWQDLHEVLLAKLRDRDSITSGFDHVVPLWMEPVALEVDSRELLV